jgi:hypothetical protein
VPKNRTEMVTAGCLTRVAEEVVERFVRGVPEPDRSAMLREVRKQLGTVLCAAPTSIHPVKDMDIRAGIAAALGATYDDVQPEKPVPTA